MTRRTVRFIGGPLDGLTREVPPDPPHSARTHLPDVLSVLLSPRVSVDDLPPASPGGIVADLAAWQLAAGDDGARTPRYTYVLHRHPRTGEYAYITRDA